MKQRSTVSAWRGCATPTGGDVPLRPEAPHAAKRGARGTPPLPTVSSRYAHRVTICTGLSKRTSLSTALGMSCGTVRSSRRVSGRANNVSTALASRFVVVSCPAVRRWMQVPTISWSVRGSCGPARQPAEHIVVPAPAPLAHLRPEVVGELGGRGLGGGVPEVPVTPARGVRLLQRDRTPAEPVTQAGRDT